MYDRTNIRCSKRQVIVDDFIHWLLASPTPSIRYLTLRRLLDREEDAPDVQIEREAMRTSGPIPAILEKQAADGHWDSDLGYYGPKYVGNHWSMLLLMELAVDPDDPRLSRGVDFMLSALLKNKSRNVNTVLDTYNPSIPGADQLGLSCLWGNVIRYAAYCHRADDPRLRPFVDYVIHNLDSGGSRCKINGSLPCAWGAIRALWALAALPVSSEAAESAIREGLSFMLDANNSLATGDYPTPGSVHKLWGKLSFPLFYQADVLFALRVLGELNALGHPGVQPALDWLASQRRLNGRWRGTSPYGSRTWEVRGDSEDTSRWVSLHAATVLKQAELQRQMA